MTAERVLRVFMRCFGTVAGSALFFVFVPYSWMNAIHEDLLGMGTLPADPIVGYLARSLSAFYAIMGGLMWLMSFDVRRYRPAVLLMSCFMLFFGPTMIVIDTLEGMPGFWIFGEGPAIIPIAAVLLWLAWRVKDAPATTSG
jgi:hypothetical protein